MCKHAELTLEQQLNYNETKAGDGDDIPYLDSDLVPIGLGLMANAIQQLVQAQIVIIQIRSVLHHRGLANLCRIDQSQAPAAHLPLSVMDEEIKVQLTITFTTIH